MEEKELGSGVGVIGSCFPARLLIFSVYSVVVQTKQREWDACVHEPIFRQQLSQDAFYPQFLRRGEKQVFGMGVDHDRGKVQK